MKTEYCNIPLLSNSIQTPEAPLLPYSWKDQFVSAQAYLKTFVYYPWLSK